MDTMKDTKMQPATDAVIKEQFLDLIKRLEAAEKERDKWRDELDVERMRLAACGVAALGYFTDCAQEYKSASLEDVLRLCAKIEAMERQEPVAWTTKLALEYGASRLGFQVSGVNMWGENGVPLYALSGAKGE